MNKQQLVGAVCAGAFSFFAFVATASSASLLADYDFESCTAIAPGVCNFQHIGSGWVPYTTLNGQGYAFSHQFDVNGDGNSSYAARINGAQQVFSFDPALQFQGAGIGQAIFLSPGSYFMSLDLAIENRASFPTFGSKTVQLCVNSCKLFTPIVVDEYELPSSHSLDPSEVVRLSLSGTFQITTADINNILIQVTAETGLCCGQPDYWVDNVTLSAAPVPVPAAAWLFGSALGLLGWMGRRAI